MGDLGASSVLAAVPPLGDFKSSRQITGQERPLRQGQRRRQKHPNALLKFNQLFRDMTDSTNREDMTSWGITKKEEVEPRGHAGRGNIK